MKGYFAFPPPPSGTSNLVQQSTTETTKWIDHSYDSTGQGGGGVVDQAVLQEEQYKRREQERVLGERSEIEWVRAGGVLRDAFGRRDRARTEQIRQELQVQEVEKQKMAGWDVYEARWRAMQSPSSTAAETPITFVEFPWPLEERVSSRDLRLLTRAAVSKFLFESLSVRTNITTKKERIRSSLLRWHPDKISLLLDHVLPDDLELVREGIHAVFNILKALQDAERTGAL